MTRFSIIVILFILFNICSPISSSTSLVLFENTPPVAVNDTFILMCYPLTGNLIRNDYEPDNDDIIMDTIPVKYPQNGDVTLARDGSFHYKPDDNFFGIDSFVYQICDTEIPSLCDTALVIIYVLIDPCEDELDCIFYPNPNKDFFSFKISGIEGNNLSLKVFTIAGKQILHEEFYTDRDIFKGYIDLSGKASGIYFVKLNDRKCMITKLIVIQ